MYVGFKFLFKVVGIGIVVIKFVIKSIILGVLMFLVEYFCIKDYKIIVFLYICRYFYCYLIWIFVCVNVIKLLVFLGKK